MKTITAMTFRKKFGSVLNGVVRHNAPVAVSRGDHPMVVVVPYATYQEIAPESDRLHKLSSAFEQLDAWRRGPGQKLKGFKPVDAIRAIREGR